MSHAYVLSSPMTSTTKSVNHVDTLRKSPILSYLDEISNKSKFNYIIIILVITLLLYRLNIHWTIWMGLIFGIMVVYYHHERDAKELNIMADQLWNILKGPLLRRTKYFITDPPLIQWVDNVSEFKKYNTLEFNKMIINLDRFLKMIYNLKRGVYRCKENMDIIVNLKVQVLNQFHSIQYKIDNIDLVDKFNHYFNQLGLLMNERHKRVIDVCQSYYLTHPINIDSRLDINKMDDPCPNDDKYNNHYNYYS
jgi:hypothetical protein